jgi:transposase-like protein
MFKMEFDNIVCLNTNCPDYLLKNNPCIIKKGFNARGIQMFKCTTCGMRFPQTKGTILYRRHLSEEEILLICQLLVYGNGVRAIERITYIHRDTVSGVIDDLINHTEEIIDMLITSVGLAQVEVDMMWLFISKIKRNMNKEVFDQLLDHQYE